VTALLATHRLQDGLRWRIFISIRNQASFRTTKMEARRRHEPG